jgi:uncharacterized protein (DUF4415 family)
LRCALALGRPKLFPEMPVTKPEIDATPWLVKEATHTRGDGGLRARLTWKRATTRRASGILLISTRAANKRSYKNPLPHIVFFNYSNPVKMIYDQAIEWSSVWCAPGDHKDFGELREIGYAVIDYRLYCVMVTQHGETFGVISLVTSTIGRLTAAKKQPQLIGNTPEKEAAIAHGIATDPDRFEPIDEEFAEMKRRGGLPRLAHPKVAVAVRYDAEKVERFKAGAKAGRRA